MSCIYVGIDQSLVETGICILGLGDKPHFQSIRTGSLRGAARLSKISDAITSIITSIGAAEIVAVREGYSYGSKSSCVFELGELGGVINVALFKMNGNGKKIELFVVPPTTWKKFVFGKGDTKKDSSYLLKTFKATGIEFAEDNTADAYMMVKAFIDIVSMNVLEFGEATVDRKMACLSAHIRKVNKITERNIGKLELEEFRKLVMESVKEYKVF